jgi:putative LysE/RhtB family amino acid efflux pump
MSPFLKCLATGFAVAAPVGPIGLLCIQRTLRGGFWLGVRTGLGAACADALYGALAAAGLGALQALLVEVRRPLQLLGSALLLWLGVRALRAAFLPPAAAAAGDERFPLLSTFALTLTNPLTIFFFLSVLTSFGVPGGAGAAMMVGGVFLGSAAWWLLLAGGVSVVRHALGARVQRGIGAASGVLLVGFAVAGLVAGARGGR